MDELNGILKVFRDQQHVSKMLLREHGTLLSLLKKQLHSAQEAQRDHRDTSLESQADAEETICRLERKINHMSSFNNWNLSQKIAQRSMEFEGMRAQAQETYDAVSLRP